MHRLELIRPVIGARPEVSVNGDSRHDQMRMRGGDLAVIHRAGPAISGRNVVDQDVRAGQQVVQLAPILSGAKVERHTLLVGIQIQEHSTSFGIGNPVGKRSPAAGLMTLAPSSASILAANAAATPWPHSTTVTSVRGSDEEELLPAVLDSGNSNALRGYEAGATDQRR